MPASLDGLDRAQSAAVTHPSGPLLIVAGAGTGKTRTLTRRFAWLVEQGLEPDHVLALTFSTAAAAEMRERVEALIEAPAEQPRVFTFHGFCRRLLAEESLEAGVDPFFVPVTPADRLALLLERLGELTIRHHQIRGNPAPLLAGFVARIDRLKDEMVTAEEFRAHAERLAERAAEKGDAERARAARELEFAGVYADHDRLLADRGALDFGDLILRAFRMLHERPDVRERVAARHAHVLVDEYQDTNFAQGMLLRLLVAEHRNVAVVGDDDQAIYRFRGASRKNLREFEREFPDAKVVRLERSHRSGQRILDAAHAVVAPVEGRFEKQLKGSRGGTVRFWRCAGERAQAQAIAAEAERLIGAGADPARIAVLVRSVKQEGASIGAALEERAVPFRLSGAAAFFHRAEVRDVLAWLRLLADPNDSGAVVRALSRPPIELRSVDLARLTQLARRRKLDMPAAIGTALEGPQLTPEGRERASHFLRLYRSASRAFEDRRPDAFVLRLIEHIGIRRQQVFATQADTVERLRNIAKLPELATAYMRREPQATARDFTRYLAAVAESGMREEEADDPGPAAAVRVLTMHAAKGLEFDHVFVAGLSASRFPGPFRPRRDEVPDELLKEELPPAEEREAAIGELRRLLHVAMTRARQHARARMGGRQRSVAVLRGGARGAGGRGGAVRGGVVRARRGAPRHLPDHARRAARQRRPDRRPARRDAARHLPRRRPGGRALPRAAEGVGADRAHARRPGRRAGAARAEPDPRPGGVARAARDPRPVRARRVAARLRPRRGAPAGRARQRPRAVARHLHPPPRRGADAVGVRHRDLPDRAR